MKRLFFFLLMFTSTAFATAPVNTTFYRQGSAILNATDLTTLYPTVDQVCAAIKTNGGSNVVSAVRKTNTNSCTVTYCSGGSCGYKIDIATVTVGRSWCPATNSPPDTSKPLNEQCDTPPPVCEPYAQSSVKVSQGFAVPGTNKSSDMSPPTNINGCRVLAGEVEKCTMNPATKEVFCTWRVTQTGAAAPSGETPDSVSTGTDDTAPTDVPEFNPAQGQGCPKGTVNLGTDSTGGSICGGKGTSPTTPTKTETKQPTQTTNNADGSTTKTDVTTRTNTDGSTTTTTTTTTTRPDGSTTTTTSSQTGTKPGTGGSGGGAGQDDSSDEQKSDFCKKNPMLNVCKNSSVSGDCNAGFSCEGDAIQCAIYRSQQKTTCEWNKENDFNRLANNVLAGNDPKAGDLPTKQNAATINMQTLEQGGFLGGGQCFEDKHISVQGHSITLPFSEACGILQALRYVIMIVAALVSLNILRRPVLGD